MQRDREYAVGLRKPAPTPRRIREMAPAGFALHQPPVHGYGLLLMFASVPAQVRQLVASGLRVEGVYGEHGAARSPDRPDDDSQCCYVCRKSAAPA